MAKITILNRIRNIFKKKCSEEPRLIDRAANAIRLDLLEIHGKKPYGLRKKG